MLSRKAERWGYGARARVGLWACTGVGIRSRLVESTEART